MRRLRVLAFIAASLVLFASLAQGQQTVHRIGVIAPGQTPENTRALLEGLRERGYVVGRDIQIEYRDSQIPTERIPALVAELVALGPEVIIAAGPQNTVAVHAAAPRVPLVFVRVGDPITLGLVESLAHPGGNVTGFAGVVPEAFVGKQLQFLKVFLPQASRLAVLINPTNPLHQREQAKLPEFERLLGVKLLIVEASTPDQFETAFEAAREQGAEGIQVVGDALTFAHSAKIVSLAARYQLPAMYSDRRNVLDGGLMSYGPSGVALWRRAGDYVGKILKGERPGNLPVQQPPQFDLIVNLKTAAVLGITVPPAILVQANEVIE